ncbi:hypothetical protein BC834DRAFT_84277 [Gloeopeniophorella convolvens]|nr:hypothetical protein BC834DRAFT_84277 [Gloeopeniophorella convolvens]
MSGGDGYEAPVPRLAGTSTLAGSSGGLNAPRVTIDSLPDDVLLREAFDWYRLMAPVPLLHWFQFRPARVCSRWRQIILASPRRLNLYLSCLPGFPITDMIQHSPPCIPLEVEYATEWNSQDASELDSLLRHRLDRMKTLILESSFQLKLAPYVAMMNTRAPILECLILSSYDFYVRLPSTFLGDHAPCLQELLLANILPPLPFAPNITQFAFTMTNDVSPDASWFNDLLTAVCSMCKLNTLSLTLETGSESSSLAPIEDDHEVAVLPRLYMFEFIGTKSQLKAVDSRLGVPDLEDLTTVFLGFVRRTFIPFLPRFFRDSKLHIAYVGISIDNLLVGSPPSKDVRFDIGFPDEGESELAVRLVGRTFEPLFRETHTLSLGFGTDHTYDGISSEEVADAAFWLAFFSESKFVAVEVLWVDEAALPALTEALDQAGPALFPKLTAVGVSSYEFPPLDEEVAALKIAVDLNYEGVKVDWIAVPREEWSDRFLRLERLLSKQDGDELGS